MCACSVCTLLDYSGVQPLWEFLDVVFQCGILFLKFTDKSPNERAHKIAYLRYLPSMMDNRRFSAVAVLIMVTLARFGKLSTLFLLQCEKDCASSFRIIVKLTDPCFPILLFSNRAGAATDVFIPNENNTWEEVRKKCNAPC